MLNEPRIAYICPSPPHTTTSASQNDSKQIYECAPSRAAWHKCLTQMRPAEFVFLFALFRSVKLIFSSVHRVHSIWFMVAVGHTAVVMMRHIRHLAAHCDGDRLHVQSFVCFKLRVRCQITKIQCENCDEFLVKRHDFRQMVSARFQLKQHFNCFVHVREMRKMH